MGRRSAASGMVLGAALMVAGPALPDAFWTVPAEVRDRATVVVSGRYKVGRGPCELLPDGSRRWPLLRGFETTTVHRGEVKTDYIGVGDPRLLGSDDVPAEGATYVLLLRPSKASLSALRTPEGSRSHRDALPSDEVLAIVAAP